MFFSTMENNGDGEETLSLIYLINFAITINISFICDNTDQFSLCWIENHELGRVI